MERAQIELHLAKAAEHIRRGEEKIIRQRTLIEDLKRDDRDTTEACRLLSDLQQTQIMHFADRDRLLMALAKIATEETLHA